MNVWLVGSYTTVTGALATAAPSAPFTVPLMPPVVSWACAVALITAKASAAAATLVASFLVVVMKSPAAASAREVRGRGRAGPAPSPSSVLKHRAAAPG